MVVHCEQMWREISNYVDGEVAPDLRAAMDEHFHACQRCASVLSGMRNVVTLYGDERMLEVPAGFGRRLEKKLAQTSRAKGRWSTWTLWLAPVGALALMIGVLRVANFLTPSPPVKSEVAKPGQNIPPDLVVLVATDAKTFHVAGCALIQNKNDLRTMTAKEAMRQGYVPCTHCLRKYLSAAEVRQLDSRLALPQDPDVNHAPPGGQ
jgi:hypothetical protein